MTETYYAVHDDSSIYGVGTCDPDTLREDTSREIGYDSYAEMLAEGNQGFDVTEIDPDLAMEIEQRGYDGGPFSIVNGVIVRR